MDFSTFVGLYLIMRLHSERNSIFRDPFSKSIFSYSFEDSDLNPFAVSSGKPCPKRNRSLFLISGPQKNWGPKTKFSFWNPQKISFLALYCILIIFLGKNLKKGFCYVSDTKFLKILQKELSRYLENCRRR